MINSTQFEERARRKIAGWYANKADEDKAVARLASQRKEIIDLLRSTCREGVENVLQYLDDSGFYYRASSANGHHNFPGGLAEHCLGTYKHAKKDPRASRVDSNSLIICALLHDICKSDRFWFKGRSIRQHTPKCELDSRHSVRSIAILKDCGLQLSQEERRAIRWHMKGANKRCRNPKNDRDHSIAIKEDLWNIVFWADKNDAKEHPGRKH